MQRQNLTKLMVKNDLFKLNEQKKVVEKIK